MKRLIAVFVLIITLSLSLPSFVSAGPTLPDYKKGAQIMDQLYCDGGKSNYTLYDRDDDSASYSLIVINTPSNSAFYYILDYNEMKERFYIKMAGSELVELSHKAADKELAKESQNLYQYLHRDMVTGKNDCRRVI